MFLLEIGDGVRRGDGPCREGILSLGETPLGFPLRFTDIIKNLKKPFPYESKHAIQSRESEQNDSQRSSLKHSRIGGYVTLGTTTKSYDYFWILICEGFCRGEVWIATWSGEFFPCTPRMTFKDWLQDWVQNDGQKLRLSLMNTGSPYFVEAGEEDSSDDEAVDRDDNNASNSNDDDDTSSSDFSFTRAIMQLYRRGQPVDLRSILNQSHEESPATSFWFFDSEELGLEIEELLADEDE
ncbi:hypothetical protein BDF20DRAFT_916877 [Mycotypha africana]|uniref:uncharacterized protein n=1 Tax=Mycotypha africana TaxID=64632 RepID=UPI002301155F|nr:uncharacterized protein BDF20DRAFT_916877 [Mycotypha africana]KAI8968337.1 hypothetical protein BDF20DRAFT_916877 [Mycotypha africana]